MKAFFQIECSDNAFKQVIIDNFLSLDYLDDVGFESDNLTMNLKNPDWAINDVPRGSSLRLWLGYLGQKPYYKGEFTVDKSDEDILGRTITVHTQSANMLSGAKVLRSEAHEGKLRQALSRIANRNGWQLAVSGRFAATVLPWTAQQNESDMNFISRLARLYHAVGAIKNNTLVFTEKNGIQSASGQLMPAIDVPLIGADSANYQEAGRNYYTGASAAWQEDRGEEEGIKSGVIQRGSRGLNWALRETYSAEEQAIEAAEAAMARINGEENTLSVSYKHGNPAYQAGAIARLTPEWPEKMRAQNWSIKQATLSLSASGGLSGGVQCVRSAVIHST